MGFGMYTLEHGNASEKLQRMTMTVTPPEDCGTYTNGQLLVTATHFCARDISMSSALCTGDLGGAIFDEFGVAMGIASIGAYMCDPSKPILFTRLSLFRDWVQDRI